MRSGTRIAVPALLLASLIAGCRHRQPRIVLPPQASAPSRPPSEMAELIPPLPPVPPATESRTIMLDTTVPPEPQPETHERWTRRPTRRRKSAQDTAAQNAARAAQTEQANEELASGQPTGASPIGQLSTAGGDSNAADRNEITEQINKTENALNGLHRHLTAGELKTVAQVRTFITRAREALKTNDLDGARTLSTKAHLLLDELLKQ